MLLEDFFDLRIATLDPGEPAPPDAHIVRVADPSPREATARVAQGWFYKPSYVTYVLRTPVSIEGHIEESFRAGTRNKPRRLLREVPARYRLEIDEQGRRVEEFKALYRATIVAKPRGRDRVSEHDEGFVKHWVGFHLFAGESLVAGVLVHELRDHLSVAYGAFDPAHRELDLEHYLILQALQRCIERRVPALSLGMDTNRYGHHLAFGLAAYKLRIGFRPFPWEPAGREVASFRRFDVFEKGLFFYSYEGRGLVGNLFTRGEPDLNPYRHHNAPELRTFRIES